MVVFTLDCIHTAIPICAYSTVEDCHRIHSLKDIKCTNCVSALSPSGSGCDLPTNIVMLRDLQLSHATCVINSGRPGETNPVTHISLWHISSYINPFHRICILQ